MDKIKDFVETLDLQTFESALSRDVDAILARCSVPEDERIEFVESQLMLPRYKEKYLKLLDDSGIASLLLYIKMSNDTS